MCVCVSPHTYIYTHKQTYIHTYKHSSTFSIWDRWDLSPHRSYQHIEQKVKLLGAHLFKGRKDIAISFSRGSSQPRDRTQVSSIEGRFFTLWATRKATRKFISLNKQLFLHNKIYQITDLILYQSSLALPWHHLRWLSQQSGSWEILEVISYQRRKESEVSLPGLSLLKHPIFKTTAPASQPLLHSSYTVSSLYCLVLAVAAASHYC